MDVQCQCVVNITPSVCSEIALQALIIVFKNVRFLPDDTADCQVRKRTAQKFNLCVFSADRSVTFRGKGVENI
jgi:hypothetical protein